MKRKWMYMFLFQWMAASTLAVFCASENLSDDGRDKHIWRPEPEDPERYAAHFEYEDRVNEMGQEYQRLPLYECAENQDPHMDHEGTAQLLDAIKTINELILDIADDAFDNFQSLLRRTPKIVLLALKNVLNEMDIRKVDVARVQAIILRTIPAVKVRLYEDLSEVDMNYLDQYKTSGPFSMALTMECYLEQMMDLSDLKTLKEFLELPIEVQLYTADESEQWLNTLAFGVVFDDNKATFSRMAGYDAAQIIGRRDAAQDVDTSVYEFENKWLEHQMHRMFERKRMYQNDPNLTLRALRQGDITPHMALYDAEDQLTVTLLARKLCPRLQYELVKLLYTRDTILQRPLYKEDLMAFEESEALEEKRRHKEHQLKQLRSKLSLEDSLQKMDIEAQDDEGERAEDDEER